MDNQDKIFFEGEGDNWFLRNRSALIAQEKLREDNIIQMIKNVSPPTHTVRKVLEIGAANGWRLEYFKQKFDSDVTAVEPSKKAIEDGKKRFRGTRFIRSTASNIPLIQIRKNFIKILLFV